MDQEVLLTDTLALSEGVDVEFKAGKGGLPRSLWETYSAFANTNGGTIWLGIAQKEGGALDLHGVPDVEKVLGDLWSSLHNRERVSRCLLLERHVSRVSVPQPSGTAPKVLIRLEVPRADRRERPVYVGQDPFQGTYRRNHEGDYHCTEAEVRRMFADQSEEPTDSRILQGFSLADIDLDSLRQYRNRFASREPNHPWLSEDDLGLLTKLGGWRSDRRTGEQGLTVAGLLMFGRHQAICDPDAIHGFHLDYRERLSVDPEIRWSDRLTLDGTWEGNLFQFYQRVMAKLAGTPELKSPFLLDAEGYRKRGTPLHEALQEGVVNALIHGDYSGQGGIVLERFADRFEFSNPGTLLVSREQLLGGGVSECRNKSLQLMFQMLGVGDKAGSGIGKIRSSWAGARWQAPRLRETIRPDRVVLVLPMVSMMPEGVLADLRAHFGDRFAELDEDQVQVVVTAAVEGWITNQRLQEMLPIHPVDITKMLQALVRKRFLAAEGVGRGTRYTLEGLREEAGHQEGSAVPESLSTTGGSLLITGSSLSTTEGSLLITGSSLSTRELPPPVWEDPELLTIAARVRGVRSPVEQVRSVLLELCRGRYLTAIELARLLDKEPATIRVKYITGLIQDGLIHPRFPQRNHPSQAYTSVLPRN